MQHAPFARGLPEQSIAGENRRRIFLSCGRIARKAPETAGIVEIRDADLRAKI